MNQIESTQPDSYTVGRPIVTGLLRSSDNLGELFEALAKAQGELSDPAKTKTAKVPMKAGGNYSYKYSDLADLLKIVRPVFAKHGLCLLQFPVNPHRGAVTIVTRIGHKSNQWIEGDLTLLVGDDKPQTLGSAITYGRRYSAGGAAGMSADEDEDGQTAQQAADAPPKNSWQSRDKEPPQAATGARAAAETALKTPLVKASIFNVNDDLMQKKVAAILKTMHVDEEHWQAVGDKLHGRPSTDLKAVIAEVTAHA